VLLVNPPIYDFSAFDFWLKPYGLLRVGGYLRNQAELFLFDYLDRHHPQAAAAKPGDIWGRGHYRSEVIPKPPQFKDIKRRYRRYGIPRLAFQEFLASSGPFDFVLVTSTMTYWYEGIREVIEDCRRLAPSAKIAVGGLYPTLCPEHAKTLEADLLVFGTDTEPLWELLAITPDFSKPPLWEAYPRLDAGVIKLTEGCPLSCSYCATPRIYPRYEIRPLADSIADLSHLLSLGASNIVFYDDALLVSSERILIPFLEEVKRRDIKAAFHTPNALHVKLLDTEVAEKLVEAGIRKIFLGVESSSTDWRARTGNKYNREELETGIEMLKSVGVKPSDITAYLILGHPLSTPEQVEESIRETSSLGIRVMLSEFSPIPQTPDGELTRAWLDLDEPLWHNKIIFSRLFFGEQTVQRLKDLTTELNRTLPTA